MSQSATNAGDPVDPPAAPAEIVCPACGSKISADGSVLHERSGELSELEDHAETYEALLEENAQLKAKIEDLTRGAPPAPVRHEPEPEPEPEFVIFTRGGGDEPQT